MMHFFVHFNFFLQSFADKFFLMKPVHFIKVFWFFFIFDLPRYVLIDIVFISVIIPIIHREKTNRERFGKLLKFENPLVSVIIPGKNEGKGIRKCVLSLREQTYKNLEIIVIDDGSDDNMRDQCNRLLREGLIDRYLRNEERGGKASAANFGFRMSHGKYIVHMDADSSLDRDAIFNILTYFYDPKVGAVSGNVKVRNMYDNWITACQAIEYMKTISMSRWEKAYLRILRIVSGAFGAFKRELVEQIGGWDIGPGLDGDITVKIMKTKNHVSFAHDAVCLTNAPTTLKALINQRLRWNRSLIRMRLRKHRNVFAPEENFNIFLFLSVLDNIFFNLVLAVLWLIYHVVTIKNFPASFFNIILMNLILYTMTNYIQFFIVWLISERKREESRLFIFIQLMSVYLGYILRPVRLIAYFDELLFKSSYRDPWNPRKVSDIAKKLGF